MRIWMMAAVAVVLTLTGCKDGDQEAAETLTAMVEESESAVDNLPPPEMQPGFKRVAGNLHYIPPLVGRESADAEACQSLCIDESQCKAWSWKQSLVDPNKGSCTLLSAEGEAQRDGRSTAGVLVR